MVERLVFIDVEYKIVVLQKAEAPIYKFMGVRYSLIFIKI